MKNLRSRLGLVAAVTLAFMQPLYSAAADTANYEIVARDGRLSPERLEVPAHVKLKFTLRNEGKSPIEFENLSVRVEKVVAPEMVSSVTVQPLLPGTYVFVDEFHAETGKVTVVAK